MFAMVGCSVIPVPLTGEEIRTQVEEDKGIITSDQEPVSGPISLYEAIARALSYNLDLRLELVEKTLAQRQLDLARYDQLPQFVTNLAYNSRNNFSGASSQSLITGTESLEPSTSSERDIISADLTLTWNILDFGVSYFRAQQAADRVLIAEEQKRKIINRIVQDVRTTYWRAVSNDRLINQLNTLMARVTKAIEESKEVEQKRLDKPLTALTYQRELIGIKRQLEQMQRELSFAKIQLAALMNLQPGEDYDLVIPERVNTIQALAYSPQLMEQLALENRSELREVAYEKRINAKEIKAAILGLFPGLNLNFSGNYNSNDFLFENNWLSYGTQISWNLLNVFRIPATKRVVEAQDIVLDARRLALSMAIMTQTHVSLAQFEHTSKEYATAAEFNETQSKIIEQIYKAAKTNSVSEQVVIREEMNVLISEVKYDIAYADFENAYGNIFAAMGVDPISPDITNQSIDEISDKVRQYFEDQSSINMDISMRINNTSNSIKGNSLLNLDGLDISY